MKALMFARIRIAIKYLGYLACSSNRKGHGIHSPFVFDFINQVLRGKTTDEIQFHRIEKFRGELIDSLEFITIQDYGAGSLLQSTAKRAISSVARHSLKSPKYAQLLYRVVSYYKPDSILELGTSFGLTTQYMASANPAANIITIEGSAQIAQIAQQGFQKGNFRHIHLTIGDFDENIENAISKMVGEKLFFIDGNHRYGPTMHYFKLIMSVADIDDILVFDDIYWSKEMEQAWQDIKRDKRVKYTIDLFFMGLIFLKKDFIENQDFMIHI